MNQLFSKLWSVVFYYVLIGLLFNAWNVTAWSTESKLFLLIAFVANGLGELATEVIKEFQYNRQMREKERRILEPVTTARPFTRASEKLYQAHKANIGVADSEGAYNPGLPKG